MRYYLFAALLAFATPAIAQNKFSVMLDWFVNPNHGPIIVADELGYFKDAGLDVEIIAPADPSQPPLMAASGKADLAVSYQPQLHLQIHEGLGLERMGTLIATPLNCLLVLNDSAIQNTGDLAGKKIGFSVAGVEEAILTVMLGKYDLGLSDVEMVNVNWSLSPALMSGQVDAVIGAYRNFELNQMEIEGTPGRCIYIEEENVPPYDELIYVGNPEMVDLDHVAKFLKATEKATQFIVNNPQKSWEIFSNTATELQDALNEKAWQDTLSRFALRPSAFDAGRYSAFETFLHDQGLIANVNPVSKIARDVTLSE